MSTFRQPTPAAQAFSSVFEGLYADLTTVEHVQISVEDAWFEHVCAFWDACDAHAHALAGGDDDDDSDVYPAAFQMARVTHSLCHAAPRACATIEADNSTAMTWVWRIDIAAMVSSQLALQAGMAPPDGKTAAHVWITTFQDSQRMSHAQSIAPRNPTLARRLPGTVSFAVLSDIVFGFSANDRRGIAAMFVADAQQTRTRIDRTTAIA